MVRKRLYLICFVLALVFALPAQAVQFLDTFSDTDLSEYTKTVILEQDASFEVSFASPSGAMQVSKSIADGAEQVLFMRDEGLGIGEILRVDKSAVKIGVYADFGIAVTASLTNPPQVGTWVSGTIATRQNYVAIYLKGQYANIGTIGWNGVPAQVYSSSGIWTGKTDAQLQALFATVTGLYIQRLDYDSWDAGYTIATGDISAHVYDGINAGGAVGFFADVRAQTTYGDLDNLRNVPEPATMVLLGLGSLALLRRRKS
jgi:hypothetical protein